MLTLRFREQHPPILADELDSIVGALQVLQRANELFVNPITIPPGVMSAYAGATAPDGYLLCDGAAVSRGLYSALYDVIGTTYGAGDGATTFNLPDLRQRFPLGKAASGTGATLGSTGGAIDHVHSTPDHTHGIGTDTAPTHTHTTSGTSTGAASVPHTHDFGTNEVANHSHALAMTANYGVGSASATTGVTTGPAGGHSHTGTTGSASSTSHSHSLSGLTIDAGGNRTHNHGGATVSGGGSTSGGSNPPFLTVQWIVKY